ncbi:septum site-determining protein MinC [Halanaerobacter jeridensis]|uniref:Probable septum site-determining protein MinC n=1 Tax=Halanaerobacter jeridensis TaxID=706427 RepID=A0A938XVU1_9FIRM|nr:septum site-determining protein MinC [Halanaerobacter jeridensis]MBM7556185.1 septum site-determining protein MinC [Halanaerobacter jeridensis]
MKNEGVVFKGDLDGVIVNLSDQLEFDTVKEKLQDKLAEAGNFFDEEKINIKVELGTRELNAEQKKELINIFKDKPGLSVLEFINHDDRFSDSETETGNDTLLVKQTLRSGQSISHEGNIVIQGSVNPGAEVIAEGDIIIMGKFKGIAHAGAKGNVEATISAFRLEPTQLRIAHYISRAPDNPLSSPEHPEVAFIKDKHIVIDYLKR